MGWSQQAQRRRRGFAVTACVLWLLGVEVLPNLHLAFHDADHTHGEAGEIIVGHVAIADHEHTGAAHEHDDAHHSELAYDEPDHLVVVEDHPPPKRRHRGQLAIDRALDGHAAGGLAHRLAALHRPAPPLLAPVAVPRAAHWETTAPIARVDDAPLARPTARGPPIDRGSALARAGVAASS